MTIPSPLYSTGKSQYWLDITLYVFHACTQAVNMGRRKHKYHVDYFTLNIWLPLSSLSLLALPSNPATLSTYLLLRWLIHIFPLKSFPSLLICSQRLCSLFHSKLIQLENYYIYSLPYIINSYMCIYMYFIPFLPISGWIVPFHILPT